LPAVEFAINLAVNASTGISPLDLILGRQPTLFNTHLSDDIDQPPAFSKWIALREKAWHTACDKLCTSCLHQAIQRNKHVTPQPPLEVGMLALLNSADWQASCQPGSDKLKEWFEGPYTVLRVFNHGQNVELDLPPGNQRHPMFHISKIKPFVQREELNELLPGGLL
jgi:hypothetical protein